jgi:hypothetical protein
MLDFPELLLPKNPVREAKEMSPVSCHDLKFLNLIVLNIITI